MGAIFDIPNKEKEIKSLQEEAAKADFWSDAQKAQKTSQRISLLQKDIQTWNQLHSQIKDIEVIVEMAIEEGDESLNDEIKSELQTIIKQVEALEFELMLDGEHDQNNAILSIHSGAGGIDAADWANMLLRMYLRWCEQHDYKVNLLELTPNDEAGITSATMLISGPYAYGYLRAEDGIHRLVRLSPFDFNQRRHTSFASVSVSPEIDDNIEVEINESDLRINTYRSSGAGGQHVNVTDSAVRITHIPTGIVAQCQNERSQHRNREMAMKVLRSRLYEYYRQKREEEMAKLQGEKGEISFGNQIRSYVLHPYQRVKDLRTGIEVSKVEAVLDGDLDVFINAYLKRERS
ncbi:TPA: peptide chain release factor 2 [Candidatus Poribacteria bacterium]|nr:peptide chain release factor 2 [Candidatus Poribacteria bacterium]